MMHPIVQFNYLYRDAGNYKSWGRAYFSNPDQLDLISIDEGLRLAFDQEVLFIAHQIDIQEIFIFADGNLICDDHCFHEFNSVEFVDNADFEIDPRSIKTFIEEVKNAANSGWNAFSPLDEIPHIRQRLAQ